MSFPLNLRELNTFCHVQVVVFYLRFLPALHRSVDLELEVLQLNYPPTQTPATEINILYAYCIHDRQICCPTRFHGIYVC